MRYLIEYANREAVIRVIDQVMAYDIVHGIVVQLDPAWLALWRLSQSLTSSDWKVLDEELRYAVHWNERMLGRRWPRSAGWWMKTPLMLGQTPAGNPTPVRIDTKWKCSTWEAIAESGPRGGLEPFVISVLVTPRSARETFEELRLAVTESSERIRFETS